MGSSLYQFVGLQCPFLVIALINLLAAILLFCLPQEQSEAPPGVRIKHILHLLKDRDIITGLGTLATLSQQGWIQEFFDCSQSHQFIVVQTAADVC